MARIGVLGLEPYLVSQVEQVDRGGDVLVMDPLDDEARDGLEVDAVVVSQDHGALSRLLSAHPDPPVVVIEDVVADGEGPAPAKGDPIHIQRPVSSPQLRDALDRSLGVPGWRRALRSITIEQDDQAVPDRWLAVLRSLVALGTLAWAALYIDSIGVLPLAVLTAWLVARALWWRLTPTLVMVDITVVVAGLVGWATVTTVPSPALALLAAAMAAEAGFLWGWWRTFAGSVVAVLMTFGLWWRVIGREPGDMFSGALTVVALVLATAGAAAMAKRLWIDTTQTRSSELRRFRASLYELSRRQAVVAVSFDLGTVAEDALARLIGEVNPQAALVLVADGSGPLQVAASHNLYRPPPVRLIWQPGVTDADPQVVEAATLATDDDAALADDGAADRGEPAEWRPSYERACEDGDVEAPVAEPLLDDDTEDILAAFPDIDPGADLVPAEHMADTTDDAPDPAEEADAIGPEESGREAAPAEDADVPEVPPPAWAESEGSQPPRVGSLAQRLAMRQAEREAGADDVRRRPPQPPSESAPPVLPSSVSPRSVPPPSVSPRSVSPRSVSPRSVSPRSVPPRSVPPRSVSPRSVSPPSVSPRSAEPTSPSAYAQAGLAPPPASEQPRPPSAGTDQEHVDTAAEAPPTAMETARARSVDAAETLLARTTFRGTHANRLREVVGQLAESLPDGPVYVEACEIEGELMGALVAVAPVPVEPVRRHAEETALALDSVRLFNRLRAFTRDQERARIGRSLHDGVMQTLAHVAFELDRVSNDSWDDKQVDTLGRLRDHVLGTVDEMRTVVNDLRTVRLDRGLPAALEAMALTLSPAGGPVIEVQADQVAPQPGDVEEQFLRVAEEALNNAVQHSGARRVVVRLETRDGALLLQVLDDGFGFSRARVGGDEDGGVGLTSMYQRARSIGAGLDIDTGANGTIITLHHELVRATAEQSGEAAPDPESAAPVEPPTRWWRRRS